MSSRRWAPAVLAVLSLAAAAVPLSAGCAKATPCAYNSDCPVGYCSGGACQRDCVTTERDCPQGMVCNVNSQCVPSTGTTTGTGAGGTGGSTLVGGSGGVGGSGAGGSGAGGSSSSSSSSSGTTSSGGVSPPVGRDIGKPCGAPGDCGWGCLTTGGSGYCTDACVSGADCPNGWGCMSVAGQRACVQAAAYCGGGQLCAGALCDDVNLIAAGCTLPCSSAADCPLRAPGLPGWTCSGGICYRPGDVFGPLPGGSPAQYACDLATGAAVNLCNDGLTINGGATPPVDCSGGATSATPGAPGETCADTCRYQGGCTYGFACVAIASLGTSTDLVGLCVKVGFQQVGQPCSDHSQCKYGYCPATTGTCSRDCTADGLCPAGSTCQPAGGSVAGMPFRACK